MKTVALIPYWAEYVFPEESVRQRDVVELGGRALINYTVRIANCVDAIDELVIYASDEQILSRIEDSNSYRFVRRDKDLDAQGVAIEDIIERFLSISDAEIFVLMHPKSPFLKPETVAECIRVVQTGEYDSAFLVSKARKFAWFAGRPLNYSLDYATPNLSVVEPVILESSSVYVFSRGLFERERRRIGQKPYLKEIGHFEGFEVDRPDDYEMAELIINAGFEFKGA